MQLNRMQPAAFQQRAQTLPIEAGGVQAVAGETLPGAPPLQKGVLDKRQEPAAIIRGAELQEAPGCKRPHQLGNPSLGLERVLDHLGGENQVELPVLEGEPIGFAHLESGAPVGEALPADLHRADVHVAARVGVLGIDVGKHLGQTAAHVQDAQRAPQHGGGIGDVAQDVLADGRVMSENGKRGTMSRLER